jgi:cytochrome bd-type quinol oxidase subunit 1
VIGIIAIFHIMIAHFAVGGGLYLAFAEAKALKQNRDWLPIIKEHSRFFLLLTGVFGTVSGVGIWFAIGLVQPEATSTLIHNFVFGWAIEWVFFIVELTSAAVYYYTWGRVSDKLHQQVGWVYAVSSVLTLVIINGILTFMLTPSNAWLDVAGTGQEASRFWYAFFNPTYFPSLALRVFSCLSLAGVWALVSISRMDDETYGKAKAQLVRWSATWLAPSFILMPLAFVWYLAMVPDANRHLLELGMHLNPLGTGSFTQVTRIGLLTLMTTATIAGIVYFFAYKYPKDLTFGHAASVLLLALVATGSAEFAREALRKPFVIGQHMYSNGVRVRDVQNFQTNGLLTHSLWAPANASPVDEGRLVFRAACMSCHTVDGYRSMRVFLHDRDEKNIGDFLATLHDDKADSPYHSYMPPLAASAQEINALKAYLVTLSPTASKPPAPATVATLDATPSNKLASAAPPK